MIIRPPGVEFKKVVAKGECEKAKTTNIKGVNLHIQSAKTFKYGTDKSLDVNTDLLRLSSTGNAPNVISYRKISLPPSGAALTGNTENKNVRSACNI